MAASRVIEQFKVWSPASQGYSFLGDRAPGKRSLNVPRRFMVPSILALVTLVLLFIFRDIPLSLFGPSARYGRCGSTSNKRTEVLGGVPGFLTLQNVWYRNQTFYLYNPESEGLPTQDELFSHPAKLEALSSVPANRPDICFQGSTLMLNENSQAGWSGLFHYYHFAAENIVTGIASLALSGFAGVPEQLLIPWDTEWHDRFGMNEMVVKGVWGEDLDRVVTPNRWDKFGGHGKSWVFFERITINDRWAVHRHNPSANRWNKMLLPIFEAGPPAGFFNPARETLLNTYHIHPPSVGAPRIVYIDRQTTSRRLPNETQDALLDTFHEFEKDGRAQFRHIILEELTAHEQIEAVAYADVMVGIHGNGLTHEMWMPRRSILIELFPPETFLRDYEVIAEATGHSYFGIQNDTVLVQSQWEADPGEKHSGRTHDGTPVELSLPLFRRVLEEALGLVGA